MAYKTMVVILLVLAIVVEDASAKPYPYPVEMQAKSRKMGAVKGATSGSRGELRAVPSGPDPLHHNGASPHKPATP